MSAILGVIFHFLGGFSSGSFYMAFKKVKDWAWESYWLIGGLFSWLIVPPLAAVLTSPVFTDIIKDAQFSTFSWTYIMVVLWGIGALTYGLGIRFLGMSLGNSVILGYCAIATISGILSACFNFGIAAGKPMAEAAVGLGSNTLFQNNVTYIVLLWGGLTTNFIWCIILNAKKQTFSDYTDRKTPLARNYLFSALGWHYLVSSVLFLWNGRKQTGQRRQFVYITHGFYHSRIEYVGRRFEGMERCSAQNANDHNNWYNHYPRFGHLVGYGNSIT